MRRHRILGAAALATALALGMLAPSGAAAERAPDAPTAAPSAVPPPPSGWDTVFADDFTGSAGSKLDGANWLYDIGTSYPGGADHWGTGEVETMTDSTDNVFQDGDGHLVIRPTNNNGAWSSGRVETQRTDLGAPAGGQVQVTASIKQPAPANGLGYWPAFWMLGADARPAGGTNWPGIGEVDILEDVNALSKTDGTLHCGVNPGGPCNETNGLGSGLLDCGGCQSDYHTYSVVIDRTNTGNEQIRWYLDGQQTFAVSESQMDATTWQNAVDHGFFVILNVAMGGGFPNGVCGCTSPGADTTSGAGMSVDYVAAYRTQ
ncbi:MAG TPA: glycoside hydrolase family 16 protein [Actinocatenispora sp.]